MFGDMIFEDTAMIFLHGDNSEKKATETTQQNVSALFVHPLLLLLFCYHFLACPSEQSGGCGAKFGEDGLPLLLH